jgi:hypothetical protein
MNITTCSVRVMRSYDYSHFEVTLGGAVDLGSTNEQFLAETDELRKRAMRLADKAVAQYKIAKRNADLIERDESEREYRKREISRIAEMPETDRSPEQQAKLKAWNDRIHEQNRRPRYDYEDDWDDNWQDPDDTNDE